MNHSVRLEALLNVIGEPSDEHWQQKVLEKKLELLEKISFFRGDIAFNIEVTSRNIGRGADWTVLVLSFVLAAWIIPEAHRKIRKNLEEWRNIYNELNALFSLVAKDNAILYPDEYLFLKAIQNLPEEFIIDQLELKDVSRLPETNPDLQRNETLLFTFGNSRQLIQIAVSRNAEILWQNVIKL